jgi:hypothetical protein
MKVELKQLILFYILAFAVFAVFIIKFTSDCEAYWMHDAAIQLTHRKLITVCAYLFLIPAAVLILTAILRAKFLRKFFIVHFIVSVLSFSLLSIAINQPCEFINGGNYMFIDSFLTIGYYLLKLSSYLILGIIIVITVANFFSKRANLK